MIKIFFKNERNNIPLCKDLNCKVKGCNLVCKMIFFPIYIYETKKDIFLILCMQFNHLFCNCHDTIASDLKAKLTNLE